MRRPPSALAAIGGFCVAVAVLSVATTASIVLLMPDPPALRITVAEAAAALGGAPAGLDRTVGPPPTGPRAPLLERALAGELGRPVGSVRVVWLDSVPKRNPVSVLVFKAPRANVAPLLRMVLRARGGGAPRPLAPDLANSVVDQVILTLPQPPFAAGVRDAGGRWVSVTPHRPIFGGWRLKVLAALALSLLLLAPLAWLFARNLTRPFRALSRAIEAGREPLALGGPRELRDAASAIVQLRTRLAAEVEERLRMLVAVAHDLRTPLTSLKLRIEAAPEPQRTRMMLDADRMQAMIHDVLAFARATDAPRRSVAVRAIVLEAIADVPGAREAIRLSEGPDACVIVVEQAFRRAIENLVRNAVDHAGGGRVDVVAEERAIVLTLTDAGPGIVPADRARLVRPFERGDASRNRDTGGVGLGLSIVQSFAESHGGALRLGDAPGGGTIAELRLPAERRFAE